MTDIAETINNIEVAAGWATPAEVAALIAAYREQPAELTTLRDQIKRAEEREAQIWQKGYRQGVADERESEANIGVAGFGAKVEPARNNPYTKEPK